MKSFVHGKIDEFVQWYDEDGNIINASDGGVIYADGKYHWYGMALRPAPFDLSDNGGQKTDVGVVMYESSDLLRWKFEGVILPVSKDPKSPLYGPLRFERPKIIYNEKTKQYVLWCHYVSYPGNHGRTPGTAEAGVAVCDKVSGTYKWQGTCRPIGDGSVKDCTLYKDSDGCAYFIYDCVVEEDRCLHVVKLSEDYLKPTNVYTRIEAASWREAPAIIYKNGYYYIVTSGLTSWDYNQAKAFRTRHLLEQWEDIGDPCVNDELHTTFNSQSSYAFPVEGREDLCIMMFERHNKKNFLECSYVWLPIKFNANNSISISYKEEWKL